MLLRRCVPAVLLAALAAAVSCGDGAGATQPGAANPAGATRARIVSLSPAITETVVRLGAADSVVGCTPWCRRPGVPAVGSREDRDLEAIARLRPTLVLRQSLAEDPALRAVAASVGAREGAWRLNSVDDARAFVGELGALLESAGVHGASARADDVLRSHRERIRTPVSFGGPVLFLFSVDPLAAFGQGTYVDGLWGAMGGRNAVEATGYPSLTPEDVAALGAAGVVVVGAEPPAWLRETAARCVRIDAPSLLEPGAGMLLDGPVALRDADARLAGSAGP